MAKHIANSRKKSADRKTAGKRAKSTKKKATRKVSKKKVIKKKTAAKRPRAAISSVGYPVEGKAAPALTLPASDGGTVKLSSFKGKKVVVLFFYPKDMTSGCTVEACGFRDMHSAYRRAGVEVFGISPDSLDSHEKFIGKHDLPYRLLSDEAKKGLIRYGVWQEKSMYGRRYMGVARTTVVIDKNGKVAKVFEKVKPNGHPEDVLRFIRENL